MLSEYSISDLRCITPDKVIKNSSIVVKENIIASVGKKAEHDFKTGKKYYLYPALVNIHDHFRGNYLPRVGPSKGTFYLNWAPWDDDLKSSPVYEERANVSVQDCYLLSSYKNIFSGVVTTNDHFPHKLNKDLLPGLPLRVIQEYAIEHECSSYDLKWGDGIEIEHRRAVDRNIPFITHLEEGFDEESQKGIDILEKLGCLDDHDVLIHCVGFSDLDIEKVKAAGAHVAWCPASNMLMFNVTCKIRKLLQRGINVSIGTDSTHTGSVNILEEMRYARELYRNLYKSDLDAKVLVKMVTTNPALAFRMDGKIGSIAEGKLADLLLLKPQVKDPYEALVQAEPEDIALLMQEGTPIYGDPDFRELFETRNVEFSEITLKGTRKLVKGDPAHLLKRVQENVGFAKELDFIPLDVNNV